MITVYLVESFLVLLTAAVTFFLLGTSFGWVLWGRFKKMLVEWKTNCERLNKRIAKLEDDADRAELIRHELETEKSEVIEIFAKRKKEMASFEREALAIEAELHETRAKLEASETLAAETEAARKSLDESGAKFGAKIAERTAVIEVLNERIEDIQRERDAEIGILRTKLLAAERSREEEHAKVKELTVRVAAAGRLAGDESAVTKRRKPVRAGKQPRYDSGSGDSVATPRRNGRNSKANGSRSQMDLELS